jgi:hypothetical protein
MITKLKNDIYNRPELFFFYGPVPEKNILKKLQLMNINVPSALLELWKEIGGGEIFETETILSPVNDNNLGDDFESVNNYHYSQGLSKDFLIFHVGLGGLSTVSLKDESYYVIDDTTYKCVKGFNSLEEWYENHIRKTYAIKYNL